MSEVPTRYFLNTFSESLVCHSTLRSLIWSSIMRNGLFLSRLHLCTITTNSVNRRMSLSKKRRNLSWTGLPKKNAGQNSSTYPFLKSGVNARVDLTLLPILMLGFYALQLDRGNLGNALTDTIMQDIKVNQNLINVGTQLLSAGIVILEIPSNIILQRVLLLLKLD